MSSNSTMTFPAGSLIIEPSAEWSDVCGATSAFGLVYNVLRANSCTSGSGSCNGYSPIPIYWAYSKTKSSPNRCVPTNKNMPPSPNTGVYSDPSWNDGCDFRITSASGTPIKLVTNATASNSATDTSAAVFAQSSSVAWPVYPATTVDNTVTDVGFDGGPLIIPASSAAMFAKLLDGTISGVKDENGFTVDLSPFRSNKGACTFGTTHYVYIYRAQTWFSAPANVSYHSAPPHVGVLDLDQSGETNAVSSGILTNYLNVSGITTDIKLPDTTGAQGCPHGAYMWNVKASTTYCPNKDNYGYAFDLFDWDDLANNRIAQTDASGNPIYGSFWAPHWQVNSTINSYEASGGTNATAFVNNRVGLFIECEGIGGAEGASGAGPATFQLLTCKNSGGVCGGNSSQGLVINLSGAPSGAQHNCSDPDLAAGSKCWYFSYPGDQFSQTGNWLFQSVGGSINDWLPDTTNGMMYRPSVLPVISGVASLVKADLTSPTTARSMITADFAVYGYYNDDTSKGSIHYLGGHDLTKAASPAGSIYVLSTLLALGNKDIDTQTYEVARSSPVVASLDGSTESVLQGTYNLTVPIAPTIPQISAGATSFTYPYQTGHFRGVPVSGLATATTTFSLEATTYNSSPPTFDVAGTGSDGKSLIPPANYTGTCAFPSSSTSHVGTGSSRCRIVFTNTAAGYMATSATSADSDPNWVYINKTNVGATLGPLITPSSITGLTAGDLDVLASAVVGAQLGGVDRSTAAVVPSSQTATVGVDGTGVGGRATMIYFGATDGMLHAVCGSTNSTYCDEYGRELWAFIPRVELPLLGLNMAQIQGSPRVQDMFGDFYHTGTKAWRTILTFQTGSGDATKSGGSQPAVYALDITDPEKPHVLWEYSTTCSADRTCSAATPATRRAYELGQGLTLALGPVQVGAVTHQVVFAQTTNQGTGSPADLVTAIDVETGKALSGWAGAGDSTNPGQWAFAYPADRVAGDGTFTGYEVPGGAVPVDKTGNGYITDLVLGDPYGYLWRLDSATGKSPYGTKVPLFKSASDLPIAGAPAIYSNATGIYAAFGTGGYADITDGKTAWGSTTATQYVTSVNVFTTNAPLQDTTPNTSKSGSVFDFDVYQAPLNSGDRVFSQPTVVGTTMFVTADSTDVNSNLYGSTNGGANTGTVYSFTLKNTGTQSGSTPVISVGAIAGGAGSLAGASIGSGSVVMVFGAQSGNGLFAQSGNSGGTNGSSKFSSTGGGMKGLLDVSTPKVKRDLWLRTL